MAAVAVSHVYPLGSRLNEQGRLEGGGCDVVERALEVGVGHIVVDSFDEVERLRGSAARALLRVTPGIKPSTHSYIQTGQEDSKFGFGLDDVQRAVGECEAAGLQLD